MTNVIAAAIPAGLAFACILRGDPFTAIAWALLSIATLLAAIVGRAR